MAGASSYTFGPFTTLLDIHFGTPRAPWFWWFPQQQPYYFSFLSGVWGNGWTRLPDYPVIKILPIDTQPLVPVAPLGWATLDDAIINGTPNSEWGRFDFRSPFFWKVMGLPQIKNNTGQPLVITDSAATLSQVKAFNSVISQFKSYWNAGAANFNKGAAGANGTAPIGSNVAYPFPSSKFSVPLPANGPGQVGRTGGYSIAQRAAQMSAGDYYLGPVPGGFWFQQGQVELYKQAYSFTINVGQLDAKKWDMSTFPPNQPIFQDYDWQTTTASGEPAQEKVIPASYYTGNYGGRPNNFSGYASGAEYSGKTPSANFPLQGPQIVGSEYGG